MGKSENCWKMAQQWTTNIGPVRPDRRPTFGRTGFFSPVRCITNISLWPLEVAPWSRPQSLWYLCARFTVVHIALCSYSWNIHSNFNCTHNPAPIEWPKYAEKYEDSESKIRYACRYHFKKLFMKVCYVQCTFAAGGGNYYLLLFATGLTGKTDYKFGMLVFFCIFCIFLSLNRCRTVSCECGWR